MSVSQQSMCRNDYLEVFLALFKGYERLCFFWRRIQATELYRNGYLTVSKQIQPRAEKLSIPTDFL